MSERRADETGGGGEADPDPRDDQRTIIESDAYPMRVRAGAGTGKTFTMVRKIERLIEGGVSPDRILALTFTNKAADSMREKLVEKVGPRGHDIEAYTYHAVCHELLQDYAYHADIDPRYDIATDADRYAIVHDVLDEMPYRFTNPDVYRDREYQTGAAERLLGFVPAMKRAGITPDDLDAYLPTAERLIELEDLVDRIRAGADEHLRVNWRSPNGDRLDDMREGLASFRTLLREEAATLADDGMEAHLQSYLGAMVDTCDELTAFLDRHEPRIIDGEGPYGNAFKLPAHLFDAYGNAPSGMPSIAYTLPGTMDEFVSECQTMADLTPGYRAYERRLDEETLLDYNDLVLETVDLLENDGVNDWISEQYDYVFCDEYQDTDTVQFELVQRLLTDEELFVVGDDDQAIYEWRGANSENIGRRLDEAFSDLHDETLEENFRSRQPILDLANNALAKHPARESEKELEAVDEQADATEGVVTIEAAEELEDEADQITNAISRLVAGETEHAPDEGYDPSDVAILVRKKRHARPIIDSLSAAGIPYDLGGDLAAESPGVETAIAALKAIANPADEVSLTRVLRMRYRLWEADLRQLHTYAGGTDDEPTLQDALLEMPPAELAEPDRIEQAREDFEKLWTRRETESLSSLYRELKSTMRLPWFCSEQERRDLRALDELVSSFEDGAVQPELSGEFIDFLGHQDTIADTSTESMEDQPDADAAGVSVMTIHKSKGLEFPVVFLPQLQADEWEPNARTHDLGEHVLSGGSPLDRDFAAQDAHEARRLLHVGITRAEELVVPVGRSDDGDDGGPPDDELPIEEIGALLSDSVPWAIDGVSVPVWETIRTSLPPTATDGTDSLAAPIDVGARTAAIEDGTELSRGEARDRVFEQAEAMLAGDFEAPGADLPVDPETLGEPADQQLLRRHSYTSLDTLTTCTRRHYLDYVVRAFDDPIDKSGEETEGPSAQTVGTLFHETAERAAERGFETASEWTGVAERIARARGDEHALDAVEQCIERYFACAVSDWEILSAERDFELDVDGETVIGQIDALSRRPEGELVVLDYKATKRKRSLDSDLQLPIYLLACQSLVDEPVRTAGYVYVGEQGPAVETRTFDESELEAARRRGRERLEAAAESGFGDYTAGDHCQWCPHRSLSCSDEADLS